MAALPSKFNPLFGEFDALIPPSQAEIMLTEAAQGVTRFRVTLNILNASLFAAKGILLDVSEPECTVIKMDGKYPNTLLFKSRVYAEALIFALEYKGKQ